MNSLVGKSLILSGIFTSAGIVLASYLYLEQMDDISEIIADLLQNENLEQSAQDTIAISAIALGGIICFIFLYFATSGLLLSFGFKPFQLLLQDLNLHLNEELNPTEKHISTIMNSENIKDYLPINYNQHYDIICIGIPSLNTQLTYGVRFNDAQDATLYQLATLLNTQQVNQNSRCLLVTFFHSAGCLEDKTILADLGIINLECQIDNLSIANSTAVKHETIMPMPQGNADLVKQVMLNGNNGEGFEKTEGKTTVNFRPNENNFQRS